MPDDLDVEIEALKARQAPLRTAIENWKERMLTRYMSTREFWMYPGRPYHEPVWVDPLAEFSEENSDGCYIFVPWDTTEIIGDLLDKCEFCRCADPDKARGLLQHIINRIDAEQEDFDDE